MRIVHLVAVFGMDGTSKVVQQLCRLQTKEVSVSHIVSLTPEDKSVDSSHWTSGVPITFFDYQFNHNYSLRNYAGAILFFDKTKKAAHEIIQFIKQLNPDVLHCHVQPRELIIALLAAQGTKIKLVFTDHLLRFSNYNSRLGTKERLLTLLYKKIYRHFYLVAVSRQIHDEHLKLNFVNPSIGHALIENKIDTIIFSPAEKRSPDFLTFVYVARMNVLKDHETLIKAWAMLTIDPRHKLLLVGDGPELERNKELAHKLGVSSSVVFTGNKIDILPILRSCDCGVFPSQKEGLPIALLEMMSCGLPVIVSDIPELQQVVRDGEDGLIFNKGNANDLAGKIMQIIDDPALRKKLSDNARATVLKKYDDRILIGEYMNVYHSLKV